MIEWKHELFSYGGSLAAAVRNGALVEHSTTASSRGKSLCGRPSLNSAVGFADIVEPPNNICSALSGDAY